MNIIGQSIYSASASTIPNISWGRCTVKADKIYLYVFDWPANSKRTIPRKISNIDKAYLRADSCKKFWFEYRNDSTVISVPDNPIDPIATGIVFVLRK